MSSQDDKTPPPPPAVPHPKEFFDVNNERAAEFESGPDAEPESLPEKRFKELNNENEVAEPVRVELRSRLVADFWQVSALSPMASWLYLA